MLLEQTRLDVVANNLANSNTAGFKRDSVVSGSFSGILIQRLGDWQQVGPDTFTDQRPVIGTLGTGAFVQEVTVDMSPGAPRTTGNALDLYIQGSGFFTIQTPAGLRYTRQGSFMQDSQGRLVTPEGQPVLAGGTPVGLPGSRIAVTGDGTVLVDGIVAGTLDIVTAGDVGGLKKEGEARFAAVAPGETPDVRPEPGAATGWSIQGGFVESANLNPVTEMVEMITVMRAYEANQKAIQAQDETLAKAVTEIGRL